jgi:hypothetical protein
MLSKTSRSLFLNHVTAQVFTFAHRTVNIFESANLSRLSCVFLQNFDTEIYLRWLHLRNWFGIRIRRAE